MKMAHAHAAGPEARQKAFGYQCYRCSTCCVGKTIQINPYEIARLARRLGETTAEFRAARTRDGLGTALDQTESGACIFLGREGCTVHDDRPLVCRLYPLGRHVLDDGTEWFSRMELDDGSAGEFTDRGTIADFLAGQSATHFLKAADEYFAWLCAARAKVGASPEAAPPDACADKSGLVEDLMDMDSAIARHCAGHHVAEPAGIEERKQLHLNILHRQLDDIQGASM